MWDLVGNPEDRFSHNAAQIVTDSTSYISSILLVSVVGLSHNLSDLSTVVILHQHLHIVTHPGVKVTFSSSSSLNHRR